MPRLIRHNAPNFNTVPMSNNPGAGQEFAQAGGWNRAQYDQRRQTDLLGAGMQAFGGVADTLLKQRAEAQAKQEKQQHIDNFLSGLAASSPETVNDPDFQMFGLGMAHGALDPSKAMDDYVGFKKFKAQQSAAEAEHKRQQGNADRTDARLTQSEANRQADRTADNTRADTRHADELKHQGDVLNETRQYHDDLRKRYPEGSNGQKPTATERSLTSMRDSGNFRGVAGFGGTATGMKAGTANNGWTLVSPKDADAPKNWDGWVHFRKPDGSIQSVSPEEAQQMFKPPQASAPAAPMSSNMGQLRMRDDRPPQTPDPAMNLSDNVLMALIKAHPELSEEQIAAMLRGQ